MYELLNNGKLFRASRQSRLSANDKGDNEVHPEVVHRSPDICWGKHRKTSASRQMKAVRQDIPSNGVPYLRLRSVGSLSTSGRKKEGKEKRSRYWGHLSWPVVHGVMHCGWKSFKLVSIPLSCNSTNKIYEPTKPVKICSGIITFIMYKLG